MSGKFQFVSLINVDRNYKGTGGDLRGTVPEERWVIQLKLGNLSSHLLNEMDLLIANQPKVALERLVWSRLVEIETKFCYNIGLKFDKVFFIYCFLLLVREKLYHPIEAGTDGFLKLSR